MAKWVALVEEASKDPAFIEQAQKVSKVIAFKGPEAFWQFQQDELKKYYEAHKDKFRKPESVTLSEIWLSLAGKPEAEVKAKAMQLVLQARGGADFKALAVANSERMQDGKPIANTEDPDLAADVAERLNDDEARREEDKWSA